jgi:hypothetical protein
MLTDNAGSLTGNAVARKIHMLDGWAGGGLQDPDML